ncbi:MAG: LysE family translocator [Lautropia sp.]|nr:LysE family translocator [Lautropia sp.]
MSWDELGALILMAVAGSFTPGPNTTLAAAIGANRGLRAAMPFVWAVPVGWMLLFLLTALGVGALLMAWPWLHGGLLAFGVGYMLWLAWRLAGSRALGSADRSRLDVGFGQGLLLQFANIKGWMLAISVVAGWVSGKPGELSRVAVVMAVMFCAGFASNYCYAATGAMLRRWLAEGQRLLHFNRTMALALALTALWMGWQGV